MQYRWRTDVDYIDTTDGESLRSAGDKINSFMTTISSDYLQMLHTYHDAQANQIINVNFNQVDSTVVDYLTASWQEEWQNMHNLLMHKYEQAPVDYRLKLLRWYFEPYLMQQKSAKNNTSRALYFDDTTGIYKFANNKALYDNYSDTTGVIGNIYPLSANTPLSGSFDLIINGLFYDYGHTPFSPGLVYYLSDSMDGWLIPYEEGGGGENVSLPFAIAVGPNEAILLTERAITKDLPCYEYCPPRRTRFKKQQIYTEYLDISQGDPWTDPSVKKYSEYVSIAGRSDGKTNPWNDPNIRKYTLYTSVP
jgi:hypothetical protein